MRRRYVVSVERISVAKTTREVFAESCEEAIAKACDSAKWHEGWQIFAPTYQGETVEEDACKSISSGR